MVMLATPIPLRGPPMPERGVPILYLVVAGTVLILIHIARTSLPLALLLGYTLFWVLTSGFPVRGVQILVLMVLGALLYIEASRLTASWVRRGGPGVFVGAAPVGVRRRSDAGLQVLRRGPVALAHDHGIPRPADGVAHTSELLGFLRGTGGAGGLCGARTVVGPRGLFGRLALHVGPSRERRGRRTRGHCLA